jgi:hypothetical protein
VYKAKQVTVNANYITILPVVSLLLGYYLINFIHCIQNMAEAEIIDKIYL